MKLTESAKEIMHYRKTVKRWEREGWEEVGEGGGNLWQIHRGGRFGQRILDVRIAPDGLSLFVKIGKP